MKKTYMQPETLWEGMELEEMMAASGINLDDSGNIVSIEGGADFVDGDILARQLGINFK